MDVKLPLLTDETMIFALLPESLSTITYCPTLYLVPPLTISMVLIPPENRLAVIVFSLSPSENVDVIPSPYAKSLY